MDTEQTDADDQLDVLADQETGSEDQSSDQKPDPGHSGEGNGKPDYFLEIDDRTRYETEEAARQGFQELNAKHRAYRDLGSPEELKAVQEENARLKRSHQALMGNELDPDQQKVDDQNRKDQELWDKGAPNMRKALDGHFMTREDFQRGQDARFTAKTDRELEKILEPTGRKLNQFERNRIRASAQQAMRDENDPLREDLVLAYNADDPGRFAELVAANMVPQGIVSAGADKQKTTQPRGENGKFRSEKELREAAAELEARAQKASQLPKAPPDGGGVAGVSNEQTPVELKPGSRIPQLKQTIERLLGR